MSFLFWSTTQRTDRKRQQPSVARAGQKGLPCMPTYANSRFKREATCAFTLNFWQRYASHATAAEDACIANEGHGDCSVAKLCFPIGKIILPVTHRRKPFRSALRRQTLALNASFGREYKIGKFLRRGGTGSEALCTRQTLALSFRGPPRRTPRNDSVR